ncbi:MAG: uroporphyrinogen-III C-methyltransferase [Pseudohongiellaceae bacterium]
MSKQEENQDTGPASPEQSQPNGQPPNDQPPKDQTPKDQTPNDQTPNDQKPDSTEKQKPEAGRQQNSGGAVTVLMTVLWTLVLVALGYVGYMQSEQSSAIEALFGQQNSLELQSSAESSELVEQAGRLETLQMELATVGQHLQTQNQQIQDQSQQIQEQNQQIQDQSQQLAQLHEELVNTRLRINTSSSGVNQQWLLAEAESQIRMAQQRLVTARDVRAAIALFVASDELLKRVDDTAVFSIRDALARDLAALRATPELDVQGLFIRLGALAERIDTLPLVVSDSDQRASAEGISLRGHAGAGESGYFYSLLDRLGEFVTVRRLDQPIEPMLTAQEGYYIQQNIRLLLEQARLALLREQQEIYRANIMQAISRIELYLAEDLARQSVLQELNELQNARVSIQVPDVTGTLNAFRQVMASIGVSATTGESEN